MELDVIARVHTAYPTKFGVPRQPGLVDELPATVTFEPAYRSADAVRGLEGFDYVWLIWGFSHNERAGRGASRTAGRAGGAAGEMAGAGGVDEWDGCRAAGGDGRDEQAGRGVDGAGGQGKRGGAGGLGERRAWSPTVRPPILGGTERQGVFATRSSFRPNGLGLSSVRLAGVELDATYPDGSRGPLLHVRGADMVDGTPVFDVKPYLRDTDSHPAARMGWKEGVSWPEIERVVVPPAEMAKVPEELRAGLVQVLRQDPRPAYTRRGQEDREFWVPLGSEPGRSVAVFFVVRPTTESAGAGCAAGPGEGVGARGATGGREVGPAAEVGGGARTGDAGGGEGMPAGATAGRHAGMEGAADDAGGCAGATAGTLDGLHASGASGALGEPRRAGTPGSADELHVTRVEPLSDEQLARLRAAGTL